MTIKSVGTRSALLALSTAVAQPTLDQSCAPAVGSSYTFEVCDLINLSGLGAGSRAARRDSCSRRSALRWDAGGIRGSLQTLIGRVVWARI